MANSFQPDQSFKYQLPTFRRKNWRKPASRSIRIRSGVREASAIKSRCRSKPEMGWNTRTATISRHPPLAKRLSRGSCTMSMGFYCRTAIAWNKKSIHSNITRRHVTCRHRSRRSTLHRHPLHLQSGASNRRTSNSAPHIRNLPRQTYLTTSNDPIRHLPMYRCHYWCLYSPRRTGRVPTKPRPLTRLLYRSFPNPLHPSLRPRNNGFTIHSLPRLWTRSRSTKSRFLRSLAWSLPRRYFVCDCVVCRWHRCGGVLWV